MLNSVKLWQDCKHYTNISFYVVFDSAQSFLEDLIPSFVKVVKVPDSFQPAHAKYKGRALEWFRRQLKLSETDWVLHPDEETEVNEYLVKACFDFIERGTEDVGMVSIFVAPVFPAPLHMVLKEFPGNDILHCKQLLEERLPNNR